MPDSDDEVERLKLFNDIDTNTLKPDPENKLHVDVEAATNKAEKVLNALRGYAEGSEKAGGGVLSQEEQDEAWRKICGQIDILYKSKAAVDEMTKFVPDILAQLWTDVVGSGGTNRGSIKEILGQHTFLMQQLGKILDIAMRFDGIKSSTHSISNDISHFKRQLTMRQKNKNAIIDDQYKESVKNVGVDQSFGMFYVVTNPALNEIIKITKTFLASGDAGTEPLKLIVSFNKICRKILMSDLVNSFQHFSTISMVQRIMVATALLYDHLSVEGIFVKESPVKIKMVLDILFEASGQPLSRTSSLSRRVKNNTTSLTPPTDSSKRASYDGLQQQAKNLLTFLKYSNKHLKDPSTPKHLTNLFNTIV